MKSATLPILVARVARQCGFLLLVLLCQNYSFATDKVIAFEETGQGTASKYERLVDAQNRAEQDALSKAMTKAGVDVFYGYHDVMSQGGQTSQFIASAMNIFSSGVAQYEKKDEPICFTGKSGEINCTVALRGKLTFNGQPDAQFDVSLNGFRPSYCDGDKISFSISSTKDAYLQILSIDESKNSSLVFPYSGIKPVKLTPGTILSFPYNGNGLRAILPKGQTKSVEMLQIIMTKDAPLFTESETRTEKTSGYTLQSVGDFMTAAKRLSGLDRGSWTMKLVPYTIESCADSLAK